MITSPRSKKLKTSSPTPGRNKLYSNRQRLKICPGILPNNECCSLSILPVSFQETREIIRKFVILVTWFFIGCISTERARDYFGTFSALRLLFRFLFVFSLLAFQNLSGNEAIAKICQAKYSSPSDTSRFPGFYRSSSGNFLTERSFKRKTKSEANVWV